MGYQGLQPPPIALDAKARDLPDRDGGNVGMMAEGFATMNIAEVNFYRRDGHSGDRVTNGDASVSVGSWIDQQTIKNIKGALNMINQDALMIRLLRRYLYPKTNSLGF